jgi:hypothetical protein
MYVEGDNKTYLGLDVKARYFCQILTKFETFRQIFISDPKIKIDRDCVVDITTRYGMEGPGIESSCGRDFPHTSRPALGPTQPPTQ